MALNNIWFLVDPELVLAVLRYEGAPARDPTTSKSSGTKLDQNLLKVRILNPWWHFLSLLFSAGRKSRCSRRKCPGKHSTYSALVCLCLLTSLYDQADVVIDLSYGGVSGGKTGWQVNGSQYKSPSLPTLLKILSNNATTGADFARSENTIVLPFNKVIELQIHGSSQGFFHPWHLHGVSITD
jgi:hypothetical protein